MNLLVALVLGGSPQPMVPPPEERCQAVLAMLHGGVACSHLPPPGTKLDVWPSLYRTDTVKNPERFLRAGEVCEDAHFKVAATQAQAALDLRIFATASAKTFRFHLYTLPGKSGGLGAMGSEAWKTERGWETTFPAADGGWASGPCRPD